MLGARQLQVPHGVRRCFLESRGEVARLDRVGGAVEGVALGTLYRRFRSKEDLLLAALEQRSGEELEEITVTATKREQGIYDVPLAMTAFAANSILCRLSLGPPDIDAVGFTSPDASSLPLPPRLMAN